MPDGLPAVAWVYEILSNSYELHGNTCGPLTGKAMAISLKHPNRLLLSVSRRIERRLTSVGVVKCLGEILFRSFGFRHNQKDRLLSKASTVLILRLENGIGDVVLFTPFLREIRRNLPSAWITLVVAPVVYDLVEFCPYVNEVLTFDGRAPDTNFPTLIRHWRALRMVATHLWRRRFDLAIVPRRGQDWYHAVFLAYFSGAQWRAAYSERVTQDAPTAKPYFDRLLTHPLELVGLKHEVQYNSDVLQALGFSVKNEAAELWTTINDERIAEELLHANGIIGEESIIAICPSAGVPDKVWPLAKYRELIQWIHQDLRMRIVVVGGPSEKKMGEELRAALGCSVINLAGKATLRETIKLISRCVLFVGNDSGPMHLAAAMGVPVVEISCHPLTGWLDHARSPVRFGPWQASKIVLQPDQPLAPCQGFCTMTVPHCITQITVEQVSQAVDQITRSVIDRAGPCLPVNSLVKNRKITFITFGGPSRNYVNRVAQLCAQANYLEEPFFTDIYGFTHKHLMNDPYFWKKYGKFLQNNLRGYGYWLWKPYLIHKTLNQLKDNDVLIYADAGCTFNFSTIQAIERLYQYLDLIDNSPFGILTFQMKFVEYKYTKTLTIQTVCENINDVSTVINSGQCMATVVILRKNAHTIHLINQWLQYAEQFDLINDTISKHEHPDFIGHRHDQSIYSLLVKILGSVKIPDETFYQNWKTNGTNYPIWATRLR